MLRNLALLFTCAIVGMVIGGLRAAGQPQAHEASVAVFVGEQYSPAAADAADAALTSGTAGPAGEAALKQCRAIVSSQPFQHALMNAARVRASEPFDKPVVLRPSAYSGNVVELTSRAREARLAVHIAATAAELLVAELQERQLQQSALPDETIGQALHEVEQMLLAAIERQEEPPPPGESLASEEVASTPPGNMPPAGLRHSEPPADDLLQPGREPPAAPAQHSIDQNASPLHAPGVAEAAAELRILLQEEETNLRKQFGPRHPEVRAVRRQIETVELVLERGMVAIVNRPGQQPIADGAILVTGPTEFAQLVALVAEERHLLETLGPAHPRVIAVRAQLKEFLEARQGLPKLAPDDKTTGVGPPARGARPATAAVAASWLREDSTGTTQATLEADHAALLAAARRAAHLLPLLHDAVNRNSTANDAAFVLGVPTTARDYRPVLWGALRGALLGAVVGGLLVGLKLILQSVGATAETDTAAAITN